MKDIRELLQTRPLLFDGAMGTYYKAAPGAECEQANLTDPAGVLAVHREYLAAGADAVKTNTFSLPRLGGGTRVRLGTAGAGRLAAGCAGRRGDGCRRFCRSRPGYGYRGGSGGAGIYGCGKAVRGAGGQEFPVRDPELRCGPSGCGGGHQGGSAGCLCAGVLCGPARRLHPGGHVLQRTLPGGCRKAASWMPWA